MRKKLWNFYINSKWLASGLIFIFALNIATPTFLFGQTKAKKSVAVVANTEPSYVKGVVAISVAKIRYRPQVESVVIGSLLRGESVDVITNYPLSQNWVLVVFNNRAGWLDKRSLKLTSNKISNLNWMKITTANGEFLGVYFKEVRTQGKGWQIWLKWVPVGDTLKRFRAVEPSFAYYLNNRVLDCADKLQSTSAAILYNVQDDIIRMQDSNKTTVREPIVPGSLDEGIWETFCGQN